MEFYSRQPCGFHYFEKGDNILDNNLIFLQQFFFYNTLENKMVAGLLFWTRRMAATSQ